MGLTVGVMCGAGSVEHGLVGAVCGASSLVHGLVSAVCGAGSVVHGLVSAVRGASREEVASSQLAELGLALVVRALASNTTSYLPANCG